MENKRELNQIIRDKAERLVKVYDSIVSSCKTLNYVYMSDNPGISQYELDTMIDRDKEEQKKLQSELLELLLEKRTEGIFKTIVSHE